MHACSILTVNNVRANLAAARQISLVRNLTEKKSIILAMLWYSVLFLNACICLISLEITDKA